MLVDVVIDTNVLMHADDPRQAHQAAAAGLLKQLLEGSTSLCVDEGFHIHESKNRSLIGGEYLERLTATHTATAILAHLYSTGRVTEVNRALPVAIRKCIDQSIRKPRDRTFLAVAHNSVENVLCSHDFEDMQKKKRKHLKREIGIEVLLCGEVRSRMREEAA